MKLKWNKYNVHNIQFQYEIYDGILHSAQKNRLKHGTEITAYLLPVTRNIV